MTMFGTSGIRGPVGDRITGALALDLGRGLGSLYDVAVVGRDAREGGDALARAAIAGIQEAGGNVVDVGVESTPTVARSVDEYGADAGLVVTASHNPPTDNGFKFWQRTGRAFDPELNRQLADRVDDSGAATVPPSEMGSVRRVGDASRRHRDRLPDGDVDSLSVVVDIGNGTGRLTADALLDRGCDVTTIDAQRDGSFPGRPSEPTPGNCAVLGGVVADTDADLGIAHDGDADRLVAVDGRGAFVSGDALFATFAAESVRPGDAVAAPINASGLVDAVVGTAGGSVVRTAVGDGNVAAACAEPGVVFGGEPSGAWIWPSETLAPDAHYAACRLAAIVADRGLAERVGGFPDFATKRESIRCSEGAATVAALESEVRAAYDEVTALDGLRVDTDDGWFLVRASGTEPLIRLTAEAATENRAAALLSEAESLVRPALDG